MKLAAQTIEPDALLFVLRNPRATRDEKWELPNKRPAPSFPFPVFKKYEDGTRDESLDMIA